MNKYELHIHTSECDKVAHSSGAEIVRLYKDKGYDGIVITDHYFGLFFSWFEDELSGKTEDEVIYRYLKGYYSAKNEGEKLGLTVLAGAEVRFNGTINDYLVYGLEEEDFYKLPFLNELKNLSELRQVLPEKAVIVGAHPFRNNMTVNDPEQLFGVEVYNGGTEPFRNELARLYAEHYGLTPTSGSDYHHPAALAKGGIETNWKITTSADLVKVLKSREYSIISSK